MKMFLRGFQIITNKVGVKTESFFEKMILCTQTK